MLNEQKNDVEMNLDGYYLRELGSSPSQEESKVSIESQNAN